MKVPFFRHPLTKDNLDDIGNVMDSLFIGTGPVARQVEEQISDYFNGQNALLTNSWTNGAIIALLAIGLKPGDEVIIPAMTFIASANVVELLGGKPVFVDVDPKTLLMTPKTLQDAVTERTKMIMPVHLYGQICDVRGMRDTLNAMGREDIMIFEDAAHSFEALRDGEKTGTYGDLAAFSFYATKNISCGEGGAVITKHDDLAAQMMKTRTHGMSAIALNRYQGGHYNHWDMDCIGGKANMPDLLACLLPKQIKNIDAQLVLRRSIAQRYRDAFKDTPLRLQHIEENCISAEHLFVIHVPPTLRDQAIGILNGAGISVTVNYRSVPRMIYYHEKYALNPEAFPVSYEWGEGCIALPLYPSLPKEEQDYVIDTVLEQIIPLCTQHLENAA